MNTNKTNPLSIISKGIAMGIADVIPGVSGGTLALLLGIYDRFIHALKGLSPALFIELWQFKNIAHTRQRQHFIKTLQTYDMFFLLYLLLGILSAIALASKIIPRLMISHTPETLALFVGLIIPSISVPYRAMTQRKTAQWLALIIGIGIAISGSLCMQNYGTLIGNDYSFLSTALILTCSAMIAICAMILPGISGSYLLLLLGQYFFVLGIVGRLLNDILGKEPSKHADALVLVQRFSTLEVCALACCFGIGALIGLASFSRVIDYALTRHHNTSMGGLTGMVLGSLYVLWPFKMMPPAEMLQTLHIAAEEKVKWLPMAQNYLPSLAELVVPSGFCLLGMVIAGGMVVYKEHQGRR